MKSQILQDNLITNGKNSKRNLLLTRQWRGLLCEVVGMLVMSYIDINCGLWT